MCKVTPIGKKVGSERTNDFIILRTTFLKAAIYSYNSERKPMRPFNNNTLYKNIEAEICEILRINLRMRFRK